MEADTFKLYQAKNQASNFIRQRPLQTNDNRQCQENDTFPTRFPNIFVNYPLGEMKTTDKKWKA